MTTATIALLAALALGDVTCERYPDADSVLVDSSERIVYSPDGRSETVEESWTKVLTEKGRREERTISHGYSRRYGSFEVEYLGVIGADGTERVVDVAAVSKDTTDNSGMAANIYDPLDRRVVCSIPDLRVGETVHCRTRRRTLHPRFGAFWGDVSLLECQSPIVRASIEVTAPKGLPVRRALVRDPLGNATMTSRTLPDGTTVHTCVATNSPQAFPEPDMPPFFLSVQRVLFSTAESWQEVSKWYWQLCEPHLAHTNAAMVAKVRELGPDVRRIFRFVSQEVRYMGLTLEDKSPGYAPHDVDITFDNRYGVCRDKAALLVAMLRLAGFQAYPVLISVGMKLDPDVPQPFFNHAIVAVAEPGTTDRYTLMDPTNENTKDLLPAYLADCSYLVARPEGEGLQLVPVPAAAKNALAVVSSGKVAEDGSLFLESDISFEGVNDTVYRGALARRQPHERAKTFERIVKSVAPGAELVSCVIGPADMRDTEKPLSAHLAVRLPEAVLRGETQDELVLPFLSRALGVANLLLRGDTALDRRRFPLELWSTAQVTERLDVDVSALGSVRSLPPDETVSGGFAFSRSFAVTNGSLRASRRAAVEAIRFSSAEYLRLREDLARVEACERRRPVFAVDPRKDADIAWQLDATSVDIASECAWTVTNTVVKTVLSYAGKRAAAEMDFSFNPTVDGVEIVSAVVSNRDGKVSVVTPRERNVMDCGWAASAPRYPASRRLVVNLPAVEIGSTIAVTSVRTVTNAPASYYGVFDFDSHEPVACRDVRVNGWRRTVRRPRRVPDEPGQPGAVSWRDWTVVSSNSFARAAARLRPAADVAPLDLAALGGELETDGTVLGTVRAVRDWMARFVRVAGPGLYELPLDRQLTDPAVVVKERYATRFDYVRTLTALLRGAGVEADVVLAADDARASEAVRRRMMVERPNVRAFSRALCRVRVTEGGWLGFGGSTRTYYVGTENEHTPLGACALAGADCFDPETEAFARVTVPDPSLEDRMEETTTVCVRENGSVDFENERLLWGAAVGSFRKTWSEMLPENRSRRHQELLGAVAQAATATRELETDVTGYPARRKFVCYVPDYATVSGDTIALQLPGFVSGLPTFVGTVRRTPFAVGGETAAVDRAIVRFPTGYTKVEHLPEAFSFGDPRDASRVWVVATVASAVRDGALEVTLERRILPRDAAWYPPDFIELVRDRKRIADARANRTIVVRK